MLVMLNGSFDDGGKSLTYVSSIVSPAATRIVGGTNAPSYCSAGPPVDGSIVAESVKRATPWSLTTSGGFAKSAACGGDTGVGAMVPALPLQAVRRARRTKAARRLKARRRF